MAVEFPRGSQEPEGAFAADRHLYLDASESVVVEEGDARSAYQFVAKGHPISQTDADRLGLSVDDDGKVVLRGSAPAAAVESETPVADTPDTEDDAPPPPPLEE